MTHFPGEKYAVEIIALLRIKSYTSRKSFWHSRNLIFFKEIKKALEKSSVKFFSRKKT